MMVVYILSLIITFCFTKTLKGCAIFRTGRIKFPTTNCSNYEMKVFIFFIESDGTDLFLYLPLFLGKVYEVLA